MDTIFVERPFIGGIFTFEHRRKGEIIDIWASPNLVPYEGLNYLLDTGVNSGSASANWYIGVYTNNITIALAHTYTGNIASYGETTSYSSATRPIWTSNGSASNGLVSNSLSRAQFIFTGGVTIWGAFMTNLNTKGDSAGPATLLAATTQGSSRSVLTDDELLVKYELQGTSS